MSPSYIATLIFKRTISILVLPFNNRSVSPVVGLILIVLITVALAVVIVKLSNVYFQPAPNVLLDVRVYTVEKANATKIYIEDLGGDPIYFKNKRVFVFINGHRFEFHPFTQRGVLQAGDKGVLIVPLATKVGEEVTIQLAIGGMTIFSGESASIFFSKKVTVQKAKIENLEEGLLAEWHFEEGENQIKNDPDGDGYSIYDLSGRGINGGFTYGIWSNNYVDGVNGKAIHFDGVNDYVWIDYSFLDKINPRKQVTYEAWIYPEDTNNLQNVIFNGAWYRRVIIGYNKVGFELNISGQHKLLWSNTNIQPNRWYYVVATYDGSKMRLYINGKLDNELSASGLIDYPYTNTFIGSQASTEYFKGIIDEVYIWSRALTPQEIKERFEMYADRIR